MKEIINKEQKSEKNERMCNETNERIINSSNGINQRLNEWVSEWMNEWLSEWVNEWVNEWMNEWTQSSTDKCVFLLPPIKCFAVPLCKLPTTAEHCFAVWTVHNDLISRCSAVVGSWEELQNIWLTVAKNAFVGWALSFRVRMLLKGEVNSA